MDDGGRAAGMAEQGGRRAELRAGRWAAERG